MVLSRESIFAAQDLRSEAVPVPEWGGDVILCELSAAQMAEFKGKSVAAVDTSTKQVRDGAVLFGLSCWVVSQGCVDDGGQRIFSDSDVAALGEKSDTVIDRLSIQILKLSGADKTVDDAIKNSKASRNGSSGSGSL